MASLRARKRKDGSEYYAVLYRLQGRQTSTSFDDFESASRFCELATKFGPGNALSTLKVDTTLSTMTVEQWLTKHIDDLTGVDRGTVAKYRAYLKNDIGPVLGSLPLTGLTRDHILGWVKGMQEPDEDDWVPSAKTIRNKFGYLAGALNAAVATAHLPANPCSNIGMPRDDDPREMLFLTHEQFSLLHSKVTEYWRPMVEFMVASGARWGEVAALRPGDVDRAGGTVRISRSWKQGTGGYRLGTTKTRKSKRTINVPRATLEKLDFTHEFLFVNRTGRPVRAQGFSARVWAPAVERAWPSKDGNGDLIKPELRPRPHDLRHTCASWMIQSGVPLPVVSDHLGHESIVTTVQTYGHLDRRSMAAAAVAVEAMLNFSKDL
jgi:integrase